MKYLKRFNESKNNLIELKSIGCSLDPIEGFLYAEKLDYTKW
jgi:hypothetical protein